MEVEIKIDGEVFSNQFTDQLINKHKRKLIKHIERESARIKKFKPELNTQFVLSQTQNTQSTLIQTVQSQTPKTQSTPIPAVLSQTQKSQSTPIQAVQSQTQNTQAVLSQTQNTQSTPILFSEP